MRRRLFIRSANSKGESLVITLIVNHIYRYLYTVNWPFHCDPAVFHFFFIYKSKRNHMYHVKVCYPHILTFRCVFRSDSHGAPPMWLIYAMIHRTVFALSRFCRVLIDGDTFLCNQCDIGTGEMRVHSRNSLIHSNSYNCLWGQRHMIWKATTHN